MKNTVLTQREHIWPQITSAVKATKRKCHVAVAYMGTGSAAMLPLPPGSKLVVDASKGTVSSGQTNPSELLKLLKKGVRIYSQQNLHAKVFVIGTRVFIGSSNVSGHSKDNLHEAVFNTTSRDVTHQCREYVLSMCTPANELGEEALKKLEGEYNTPDFEKRKPQKSRANGIHKERLYIVKLVNEPYDPNHVEEYNEGTKIAKSLFKKDGKYILDDIEWDCVPKLKENDFIVRVYEEGNGTYMSPPARILNIEEWSDKKGAYVYLEAPNKRRKSLQHITDKIGHIRFGTRGFINFKFVNQIGNLWK